MSARSLTVTLCIACVLISIASSTPDGQDTYYRWVEYLSRLERDGGVYDEAPEWVVELIRDRMPAGAPPVPLACSLVFKPDNWTAAGVLLDLILDDEVVARVRSDPELELSYTRAVRYLRPAIVTRFVIVSTSPSQPERAKLIWWADALMRLFPHPQGEPVLRSGWEAQPRPWGESASASDGSHSEDELVAENGGYFRTSRDLYRAFMRTSGVPSDEVVPAAIMQEHLYLIGSYRTPINWYWRGMESSWLAGSTLSPLLPSGSSTLASSLNKARDDWSEEQFHAYVTRTEYLRVWYPLYLTVAPRGFIQPDAPDLLALDQLLQMYSPEGDREWSQHGNP